MGKNLQCVYRKRIDRFPPVKTPKFSAIPFHRACECKKIGEKFGQFGNFAYICGGYFPTFLIEL